MSTPEPNSASKTDGTPSDNGFFINAGTHSGWFKTPAGDIYDIRKLEPREVTDPRSGETATLWGGYATARDRELAARDGILQTEFTRSGQRPAELFTPESKDIPLYITLRHRPGKGYSDIGSFWNARGRFTILARDMAGKRGLRFAGNVLDWKSSSELEAARAAHPTADAAPTTEAPDGTAARNAASRRARAASGPKAVTPERT